LGYGAATDEGGRGSSGTWAKEQRQHPSFYGMRTMDASSERRNYTELTPEPIAHRPSPSHGSEGKGMFSVVNKPLESPLVERHTSCTSPPDKAESNTMSCEMRPAKPRRSALAAPAATSVVPLPQSTIGPVMKMASPPSTSEEEDRPEFSGRGGLWVAAEGRRIVATGWQ